MPSANKWVLKVTFETDKESVVYAMVDVLRQYGDITRLKVEPLVVFEFVKDER